jgi:ABC-type amino acid transport substrate-binding protein
MRTRRPSLVAVALLFSVALAPLARSARADDSLSAVLSAGVLRVAAEPETPPMLFKNGARYDGFDFQIAKALAKRLGVADVAIVPGKYADLPGRLLADKADVIISGYTPDDSIAGVDWTSSYYDYGLCLVVRKGSGISSVKDLDGKVVGLFNDPAAEDEVKRLAPNAARLEKHEDGYFELLAQGKLDAFIYDYPYAQEEIKELGGRLEIVEFNLTQSSYAVGVKRGATTLKAKLEEAIRDLKASNEYRNLVKKYLGGTGPVAITKIEAGQKVYKVKPGDTLSAIARDQLGNLRRWPEIWEANRGRIADPNLIDVGWELVLPGK